MKSMYRLHNKMDSTSKMIFNTVVLYVNLVFTITVNLVATRFILNAMGVVDFGIVNLVAGLVAMFSFIQNSMSVSTQRYLSVNLGKKDMERQNLIFNTGLFLHLLLAIAIFLVLEIAMPFLFDSKIQIPEERIASTEVLYHLVAIGTLMVIVTVPFDATLNAHENMLIVACASICESFVRLIGAIWIMYYAQDRLVFYGFLLITIRLSSLLIKFFYCRCNYVDAKISPKVIDFKLMKEMFSFAFWNMFGAFAVTSRSQGVGVVLNLFRGVVINAAYGVALQVSAQISNFSSTISKVMNPQIMQREGASNREGMLSLALKQCKFSYLALLLLAVPLGIEMPYVLTMWLKDVPEHAITFCQLMLVVAVIQHVTTGLQTAIQACGRIAWYQIIVSLIMVLNIPLCYSLLKIGFAPEVVLCSMCVIEIVLILVRFIFANKLIGLRGNMFLKELILPITIISTGCFVCSVLIYYVISSYLEASIVRFFLVVLTSFMINMIIIYVALTKEEQMVVGGVFVKIKSKIS